MNQELFEKSMSITCRIIALRRTIRSCNAALEKQMPKKPDYEGDGYADGELVYDTWICPCCGKHYEIDYDDYDYCPNCGQHILWEVEDEQ